MKKHIFVFPDLIDRHDGEHVKLNIDGDVFHFFHDEKEVVVNCSLLRDGSSTLIMRSNITGNTFALYNFREILQALDLTPTEFNYYMNLTSFMQIDRCGDGLFVKAFLLRGDYDLESDTDDFSMLEHCTADYVHPLDWRFSWTTHDAKASLDGDVLRLSIRLDRSDFRTRPVFCSYGGQAVELKDGQNDLTFTYVPCEFAYIGEPYCRYKGRGIDIGRLLYESGQKV